jgi:hypothetical protein
MSVSGARHTVIDERTQWMQRIQATLFDHGVSGSPEKLRTRAGRALLDSLELPADARERGCSLDEHEESSALMR